MYHHKYIAVLFRVRQINPRSIINLVEKGVIQPDKEPNNQGGKREYSFKNIIEFLIAGECLLFGMPIKQIKLILHNKLVQEELDKGYNFKIHCCHKILLRHMSIRCFKDTFKPQHCCSGFTINVKKIKEVVEY